MIYFTADNHFSHFNIIRYTSRPFHSVGEMNDVLISNILETVKPEDMLYILGDFAFNKEDFIYYRGILENACMLVFCQGNHDNKSMNYQLATDFKHNKTHFYVCHYPWLTWRPNTVMLHGHVHGNSLTLPADSRQQWRYDVGVDVEWFGRKYYPISIEQVEKVIDLGIYPTK